MLDIDGSAKVSITAAVMELDEGEEEDEDVAAPTEKRKPNQELTFFCKSTSDNSGK